MRPIYRIWDNNSKEYMIDCVEGIIYFVKQDGELCSIDEDSFIGLPSGQDYTIELCTGLKDVNDVWIYEGNIVERYYGKKLFGVGIVTIDYPNFRLQYTNGEIEKAWNNECMKVIGNIHENPELLKETEDES